MGQTNTGITSRTLNNRAAGTNKTLLLCVLDDEKSSTVLDRATGVHELGLCQNLGAGLLTETVQTDLPLLNIAVGFTLAICLPGECYRWHQ